MKGNRPGGNRDVTASFFFSSLAVDVQDAVPALFGGGRRRRIACGIRFSLPSCFPFSGGRGWGFLRVDVQVRGSFFFPRDRGAGGSMTYFTAKW